MKYNNEEQKDLMRQRYEEILSLIQPVGNAVAEKWNECNKEEFLFAHDILMRIFKNIKVLRVLGVTNDTASAYRMILRSMFADLIEGLALLTCDDDFRESEFFKKNLSALLTMQAWIESKNDFFKRIHQNDKDTMDLQKLYELNPNYVDRNSNKFLKPDKQNHLSKKTTRQLCEKLTSVDVKLFSFFNQLYINYKYLSLTEHYHTITRRHSFHYNEDFLLYPDFLGWIALGVKILCEVIQERIDTGTFVVSYSEVNND